MRFAVIGASGRMGKEVTQILIEKKHTLQLAIVNSKSSNEYNFSSQIVDAKHLKNVDVAIDFSLPETLSAITSQFSKAGIPEVSGVTGYNSSQFSKIRSLSKAAPFFWYSNLSIGVHLLNRAFAQLVSKMGFKFVVEETHHSKKRDAPSGTAKLLQNTLKAKLSSKELQDPISIRGGGVIGHHRVIGMGEYETLCFEHQALSRKVFAAGAVQVAEWLKSQKKGLYNMENFLEKK
jgi:4-hydroxy-tetrahydrodipicolinate reductase